MKRRKFIFTQLKMEEIIEKIKKIEKKFSISYSFTMGSSVHLLCFYDYSEFNSIYWQCYKNTPLNTKDNQY